VTGARERIAWAADVPLDEALRLWTVISPFVGVVKVGLSLFVEHGPASVRPFRDQGASVFLDLKLHDIPNTVERATRQIARLGARFLTVHAYPQTMKAALAGAAGSDLELLAVTVLTSCDDADLAEAGYALGVKDLVARRAVQAKEIGMPGLILSPEETQSVRKLLGPEMALITPGIRPTGTAVGDQKRVMTPALAIAAGADRLVVARPVIAAADPVAAAENIVAEIASALA
jgi:orotidine-5'-phosphate decarboxylase